MEAIKVKAIWHNCMKCKIHYMSEYPHIRAYLCDECWNNMPHYKVSAVKSQRPDKGPTYKLPHILRDISSTEILLYTVGNLICMTIIAYYLWFK
jgi:hypothetical protein